MKRNRKVTTAAMTPNDIDPSFAPVVAAFGLGEGRVSQKVAAFFVVLITSISRWALVLLSRNWI